MKESPPDRSIPPDARRIGDVVKIGGDYQFRALTEGNAIQRFWHYSKQTVISRSLPPAAEDRVLDVGCGSGVISSFLARSGATVVGIDGNLEAVEFASKTYARSNLRFQQGLVDERFPRDTPIDKIYCMEVIEHIYESQGLIMLKTFHDLLKPGGAVLLTTPNYRSAWPVIEWLMDALRLTPRLKGDQHVAFYNARKLRNLCEQTGFEVVQLTTICFAAPWLAVVNWSLARKVDSREGRLPGHLGSVLACVLRKKS